MEKCSVCSAKISRWEIIKSVFLIWRNVKCSNCGAEFEHKTKNKILIGLITMPVVVFFMELGKRYDLGSEKFAYALIVIFLITMLFSKQLRFKRVQ